MRRIFERCETPNGSGVISGYYRTENGNAVFIVELDGGGRTTVTGSTLDNAEQARRVWWRR